MTVINSVVRMSDEATLVKQAYWNWTYDEQASYDLKALIAFVYNQRGGTQLTYIAHSEVNAILNCCKMFLQLMTLDQL